MRKLIILSAMLFVAACSTSPVDEVASSAPPPPAPPPPPINDNANGTAPMTTSSDPARQGALVQPGFNSRQFVIPASQLLPRDQRYEPLLNGPPTAVILLDRGNSGRNKAVCEAFTRRMASAETTQQLEPDAVVVLTFWPIISGVADHKDCKQLLKAYDYERAQIIAQKYSYVEMKMPVLIAIAAPNGQTFAMGMGRESKQRIRSLVAGWFTTAVAKSAIGDRYEFYTPSLFERMLPAACRVAKTLDPAPRINAQEAIDPATGVKLIRQIIDGATIVQVGKLVLSGVGSLVCAAGTSRTT